VRGEGRSERRVMRAMKRRSEEGGEEKEGGERRLVCNQDRNNSKSSEDFHREDGFGVPAFRVLLARSDP